MSETPNDDTPLSQARSEADTILIAVNAASKGPVWQGLGDEERSSITATSERLISAKRGNDAIAIRQAINALDQATRGIAEGIMAAAVQRAIRREN